MVLKKEEINIAEAFTENLWAHFVQEQSMKIEAYLVLGTYERAYREVSCWIHKLFQGIKSGNMEMGFWFFFCLFISVYPEESAVINYQNPLSNVAE